MSQGHHFRDSEKGGKGSGIRQGIRTPERARFIQYRLSCGWLADWGIGMIEWNERFGIRFMRISSEMFPFASHAELGYIVEYARSELSAAGKLAMKYGHRLTMHPVRPNRVKSLTVGAIHANCISEGKCCRSFSPRFRVPCRVTRLPRLTRPD